MKKAYLILSDGTKYEGTPFGAEGDAAGTAVFTTGVVGYVDTLTDPANAGHIVVQTFPQIGCYGVANADVRSKSRPAGYVVRDFCTAPCNFRSEGDIDSFLRASGVVGISGVDTRALTRHLREKGEMRAVITDDPARGLALLNAPAAADEPFAAPRREYAACGETKFRVTVVDFGCADGIVPLLTARGCAVTAVPCTESAEAILAAAPDGVILSDGAGDPRAMSAQISLAAAILGKAPLFGWGLGHLLMAIAAGAQVERMHCGHRGGYPVRDRKGGRTYLTSQNHGYSVAAASLTAGELRYETAVDGMADCACEGIDYPALRAFSVQFSPVLAGASRDTGLIADRFTELMGGER